MSVFGSFVASVFRSTLNMMNSASVWMMASFVIGGIMHEILDASRVRKSVLCSSKVSGVFLSTLSGMLIPICSCGSVPLGIGLYYSGAYIGPTLAFMTSSPIINPIAIILAYGLLGKEIATVYLITGFVAPVIIGISANRFGGPELFRNQDNAGGARMSIEMQKPSMLQKLGNGMRWSFGELAVKVSVYTVTGMLLAGLIFNVVPQSFLQRYLGDPGFISLLGITVIAALMYVCAIGHIPFIAAIVASGAAPGVAITFLMVGAATNIAELLTINRTIGKRSMLMYLIMVAVISNGVGYITNRIFPNFKPELNYDTATHSISAANHLIYNAPDWLKYLCSALLVGFVVWSLIRYIKKKLASYEKAVS